MPAERASAEKEIADMMLMRIFQYLPHQFT
jgi:hypothetical protein